MRTIQAENFDPSKIFPPSQLALQYCRGSGIEFGAAAHNPFNLEDCLNVDSEDGFRLFKQYQLDFNGSYFEVDQFGDAATYVHPTQVDYIISSHVLEHLANPLKAMINWNRSLKPGGTIFMIVPKRDAIASDAAKPISTLEQIMAAFANNSQGSPGEHHFVYTLDLVLKVIIENSDMLGWEVLEARATDDKVGNGFTVVCRKC